MGHRTRTTPGPLPGAHLSKTWYAVIYEGVNRATGKEKRSWVKTYLLNRWLPIQEAQLRPSTYDSYRRNIELHVVPAIGEILLRKLEADDLDVFYARLLKKGQRKKGKSGGLSVKTVRNIHPMRHKALADAQRKGIVFRNVASLADAPKLSSQKRPEMRVGTADQLRRFLEVAKGRRHYAAAHTGMRRGEILGLRWSDVDLKAGRLSVRTTVINVAYEIQGSDVKTGTGRRTIDIDRRTVEVLRRAAFRLPTFGVLGSRIRLESAADHPRVTGNRPRGCSRAPRF